MYVLSFDIGTTNIKAVLYHNTEVIQTYSENVVTHYDGIYATQDVDAIFFQVKSLIDTAVSDYPIHSVVLSVPMHSLVLLNANYEPVSYLMIWSDRRASSQIEHLSKEKKKLVKDIALAPVHSMTPFAKLLWLKENPIEYHYIGDLKSYLMYKLSGSFITDISSASASGLWDAHTLNWSQGICNLVNVNVNSLPEIVEIDTSLTAPDYSFQIVIGSTDGVMANRGIAKINECVLSIGTSIGVRYLSHEPLNTPHTFCYYAGKGLWLNGTASNNGGILYDYARREIDETLTFERYVSYLEKELPTSYCMPYAYGERGPWYVEDLSVMWSSDTASNEEKIHTLILGMIANIRIMMGVLDQKKFSHVFVTGKILSNEIIRQKISDAIHKPLVFIKDEHAVCEAGLALVIDMSQKTQNVFQVNPMSNEAYDIYLNQTIEYITTSVKNIKGDHYDINL